MTVAPNGVIPAIPTPFTPDGASIDEAALRSVVRHVVDAGVHGIMTTGGTGEFPHLSREERRRVTEVVVSGDRRRGAHFRRHRGLQHLGRRSRSARTPPLRGPTRRS